MSLLKKSFALIISVLLIISMLSVSFGMSAFAADAFKITVKSVQNVFNDVSKMYKAGDTFDIKYYVQADVDMYDGEVYLYYNNDYIRVPSKKGAELGANMLDANITGMGNYDSKKLRYGYVYMPSGYTADYRKEDVLITFHFTVLDTISSDQTINFDIYGLYAIGTKMIDGEEKADVNARTNYIFNGEIVPENKSGFKTRVELTGGSDIQTETQPVTQPVTVTEPETTTTAQVTTVPQTTAAPATETTEAVQPTTNTPETTEAAQPTTNTPETTEAPEVTTAPQSSEPVETSTAATEPVTAMPTQTVQPGSSVPVTEYVEPASTAPVTEAVKTSVSVPKSVKLYTAQSKKAKIKVTNPVGATTFSSSKKSVVKVNSKGKLTAVKKGTAVITVKNNNVSKSFKVTVKNPKLKKKTVRLTVGQTFKIKIKGKYGTQSYKSSDKAIAKVNKKGKVFAKKRGKAVITVKTNKNVKLKLKVYVK